MKDSDKITLLLKQPLRRKLMVDGHEISVNYIESHTLKKFYEDSGKEFHNLAEQYKETKDSQILPNLLWHKRYYSVSREELIRRGELV